MPTTRSWLLAGLTLCLLVSPVAADPFTRLVVFGDSLSDSGNNAAQGHNVYGTGRYTNGPVWVEVLAQTFGQTLTPSSAGGTNYAQGYARTTGGTSIVPAPLPTSPPSSINLSVDNLGAQVNHFLTTGGGPQGGDLYVIWAGSNDLFDSPLPSTIASAVNNVSQAITQLRAQGASQFLVVNQPPLGQTPYVHSIPPTGAYSPLFDGAAQAFNSTLAAALAQVRSTTGAGILELDVYSLLVDVKNHPANYGLTNTSDAFITSFSGDPDSYLFWDTVHPSARGHEIIAAAAAKLLPVPPGLALVFAGSVCMVGWRRVRGYSRA